MRSNENDNAVVANRELSRDHVIDNMPNLQRFLKRYGEEQLLSDREKTKRIRLPRKVLTHSTFMRTARNLTARAFDDKTHYDASIDRMAAAFSMDKRVTLPHPMWTSRHDAVLIHAISKHGWIDQDGAARRIADDSTVSWGSPFGHASNGTGVGLTADENLDQILATGIRAAKFLTEHSSMVEDLKDFNSYLVIRAYSLSRKSLWSEHDDDYDGFANHPSRAWEVNRGNLQGVPGLPRHMGAGALVDLPPKKDLVKRARSILTKGSPTPSPLQNQDQTTEYSVLDQKDRANIFLAEMIRALMKEPSTSKHFKALCNLASAEAHHRATVSMKMSSELTIDRRKAALDQQRIAEHIHDFRRNFSTGATQYKNVLRVILGEEAHKMRNNGENMFPVKRTTLSLKTTAIEGHHLRAPKVSSRPLGEKAITQARQRLVQKNSGSPTGSHPQELELTEIETQILSCACTIGIPIWKDDWRSTFQCEMSSSQSSSISWPTFGKFMSHEANKSLQRALEKVKQERASLYTVSVAWPSNALESANRSSATKESAATQAKDYADEPEILAKKSLMLLEKIRKHVNAMESSTLSVLSDSSVGAKVVMWLGKEISRWASSLDLLGDDGCPLAFTAVEFLDELPEAERRSIEISSLFDEKSSSHVIAQVALMTRLRSLNTAYDRIRFSAEAAKAAVVSDSTADRWDQQPLAWNPSCDLVLLRRLLVNGFTDNLLSDSLSHGGQSKVSLHWFQLCAFSAPV